MDHHFICFVVVENFPNKSFTTTSNIRTEMPFKYLKKNTETQNVSHVSRDFIFLKAVVLC